MAQPVIGPTLDLGPPGGLPIPLAAQWRPEYNTGEGGPRIFRAFAACAGS